ncbi:MAG: hypothetical protein Q8K40_03835 [Ignavibacteria bacterium]|nr:hypothetical protein [Ignavibacteria bacterium]
MSAWVSGERLRYMRRKFIGGDIKMGIKKYFPDALSLCVAEVHTKTVEVAILAIFSAPFAFCGIFSVIAVEQQREISQMQISL